MKPHYSDVPGADGAPPGPEPLRARLGQKPLFTGHFPEVKKCAPDATSGKCWFWAVLRAPGASARFGGRQGTLGPAPVHLGRDQRPGAAAGAWRGRPPRWITRQKKGRPSGHYSTPGKDGVEDQCRRHLTPATMRTSATAQISGRRPVISCRRNLCRGSL